MTAARLTQEYLNNFQIAVNAPENPVKFLSIDPGKTNGVCGYDAKLYVVFMMSVDANDMVQFLDVFDNLDKCIYEGYKLYPNKAREQYYSNMETPRVIGRIEAWAERKKIELIEQAATIKATGYLWIGQKPLPKSNPENHKMDAHVHFMYWAVKNRKIDAKDLLKRVAKHAES